MFRSLLCRLVCHWLGRTAPQCLTKLNLGWGTAFQYCRGPMPLSPSSNINNACRFPLPSAEGLTLGNDIRGRAETKKHLQDLGSAFFLVLFLYCFVCFNFVKSFRFFFFLIELIGCHFHLPFFPRCLPKTFRLMSLRTLTPLGDKRNFCLACLPLD